MALTQEQIYDMAVNDIECVWDDPQQFEGPNEVLSMFAAIIENVIEECHDACKCEFKEHMSLREEQIP